MKKAVLVLRAGLQETLTDKKTIVLLVIIGFILDNGVRRLIRNAMQVGQPVGIFEGFIMCLNHPYYLILFLVGFIFIMGSIPRLDSGQVFLIYRTGKKNWFLGEVMQVAVSAFVYILLLLAGCVISTLKYCYVGNIWSNFTVYYEEAYKPLLSDSNRLIDGQVFRYYTPYASALHGILLLTLCLTLMGSIILFCAVMDKKLPGIVINLCLIFFVLIFNNSHAAVMWISPFCHAFLALHNIFVYKELSVPLAYSYLYLLVCEGVVMAAAFRQLKNKMFY